MDMEVTLDQPMLIETQYLPPVSAFAYIYRHRILYVEHHEHYEKGSYRNRCYIAGPNGILRLSIPLQRGKNNRQVIADVRIANNQNWQHVHWQSLCSCYRSSPYFEFYEDEFHPFYHKPRENLFEFNTSLLRLILKLLNLDVEIRFTERFEKNAAQGILDLRSYIHPSRRGQILPVKPYHQVFIDKTGFIPDVSIVDLLFNLGPAAVQYLEELSASLT